MGRLGHNEMDEPMSTLPLTYARISQHPTVAQLYADSLILQGVISPSDVAAWQVRLPHSLKPQQRQGPPILVGARECMRRLLLCVYA